MLLDEGFLARVGAEGDGFVPPHPRRLEKGLSSLQAIRIMRRNIIGVYRHIDFESRIVRHPLPTRTVWVFNSPEHTREALQMQHDAFERKSPQMRRALGPLIGDGLFVSDGATWRLRRSIVAPIVHASQTPAFAPIMQATAEEWAADWRSAGEGAEVDILAEMGQLTAEIIARTVFGSQLGRAETGAIVSGFAAYQRRIDQVNLPAVLGLPDWLPRLDWFAVRRSVRQVHRVIDGIIDRFAAERRAGEADGTAVIAKLIDARDETGRPLSREAIRNEAFVIFMAGHETTANTLAWAWYLLSQSPRVRDRLSAELDAVLGGRPATFADVPRLSMTRAVIEETLRLYPPVPLLAREAVADGVVGGRQIAKGSILVVAPWLLHRNRDVWSWPDMFLPERFLPDLAPRPGKSAYIPFAIGPRVCPGLTFGLTEAVICLATLAQDFAPEPLPGQAVEVDCRLTLRPGARLPMRLRRRQRTAAG